MMLITDLNKAMLTPLEMLSDPGYIPGSLSYKRKRLEDKISIIKLSGLPEPFAIVLLTFSFILFLAPYFSGADFGLFKIPQFTDPARKKLKIIGPVIFVLLVALFIPMIPNQSDKEGKQTNSNSSRTKNDSNLTPPLDVRNQAQQHIKRAHDLFEQGAGHYPDAIKECDEALGLEPDNQEALQLKKQINNTIEILKRNH